MTPMRANAKNKVPDDEAESRPGHLNLVSGTASNNRWGKHSVFEAPAEGIHSYAAVMRLDGPIEGTVGAAVTRMDGDSYSSGSAAFLTGEFLGHRPWISARTRANDLIAELQEISGQVNRMMSQVDRAIHRLGVHAGEALRR